jgi:hypothetical protein
MLSFKPTTRNFSQKPCAISLIKKQKIVSAALQKNRKKVIVAVSLALPKKEEMIVVSGETKNNHLNLGVQDWYA